MQCLMPDTVCRYMARRFSGLCLFGYTVLALNAHAQLLELEGMPLFIGGNVPSNLIISFDDSGSMLSGYMPDSIQMLDDSSNEPEAKSAVYNKIYYDPAVDYRPPLNSLGAEYPEAVFTAANPLFFGVDGNIAGLTGPVDLSSEFRPFWNLLNGAPGNSWGPVFASDNGNENGLPAYYYRFSESCNDSQLTDNNCYTRVVVSGSSGPLRARPELGGAVSVDERTNFANWYQWYSYRLLAAKTALSRVFGPEQISDSTRIARQTINHQGPRSGDPGASNQDGNERVAALSNQERGYFYDWIWNIDAAGDTALRQATHIAGLHYSRGATDADSPYRIVPGNASSPEVSCRLNAHLLMTDSNWNGRGPQITRFDEDDNDVDLPEIIGGIETYDDNTPDHHIFAHADELRNLADVTFHYWVNDLRPDLNNDVAPLYQEVSSSDGEPVYPADFWNPKNDPATWQHMRNYMVAFGATGRVPLTDEVYQNLLNGEPFTDTKGTTQAGWRNTDDRDNNDDLFRTDDVYHAAINGRGEFFSATNPGQLATAFGSVAAAVNTADGSVTPVALNSGSISSNSLLFRAAFDTENWTGELTAFRVSDGSETNVNNPGDSCNAQVVGTLCNEVWNAAERNTELTIDAATREVYSYASTAAQDADPEGAAVDFKWGASTGLNAEQQALLNDDDNLGRQRVDYLRGDTSNEETLFRERFAATENISEASRLGPVIHSTPAYVGNGRDANGNRQFDFPDDLESGQDYSDFLASIASRPPMLYVGANDGMLHAYNAGDSASGGSEQFAYVPGPVFDRLHELTELTFQSAAYVDGPLRAQDVFYAGSWKTLLVGGLRTGGQGYYALDVTQPQSPSASDIVRWEFTDQHDDDMGYSYGAPLLVRANNGRWVVIVANGYNSAEADGRQGAGRAVLFVLDAEDGSKLAEFTVGSSSGENGLSGPVAVSADGDFNVDYVYAGDLEGNLWRFDMTSSNVSDWSDASLLFSAGSDQPITATPTVGSHPLNLGGRVIYFGTGQYLELDDVASSDDQRFYAIWDDDSCTSGSDCRVAESSLQAQTIDAPATTRSTSDEPVDWTSQSGWYLQLSSGVSGEAERVIGKANLIGGVVIFTSIIPEDEPCGGSAESFLFALDRNNGGSFDLQVFDRVNDGVINDLDLVDNEVANVIKLSNFASDTVVSSAESSDLGVINAGEEVIQFDNVGTHGRIRWRQLQ